MKLSKRVQIMFWSDSSKRRMKIGVMIKLPTLRSEFGEDSATDNFSNVGTIAEAPKFAVLCTENGDVSIKLDDNWVFVFASRSGHLRESGHFVGLQRYPDNVVCVWSD